MKQLDYSNLPIRPTRAEISLDNLIFNLNNIKEKANGKMVCAVVKADAYGHGFTSIEEIYKQGVDYLAIAFVDEGKTLRKKGITNIPILILGASLDNQIEDIIEYDLEPAVFNYDFAKKLSDSAVKHKTIVPIHIKLETGMGRIGIDYKIAVDEIIKISKLPGINIKGIFSHFCTADETDKTFTKIQLERFSSVLKELKEIGIEIPIKHIENSAALIDFDDIDFNMVRPGIILYGHYPSDEVNFGNLEIKPVMKFLTKVVHIKEIEPGDSIGYGRSYIAEEKKKVATLPVGYADGYSRILSHKNTHVSCNNNRLPVLGNICMDQTVVDITEVPNIELKSDIELFGEKITAEEIAKKLGTINYEVTCLVNKRVPRIYIKNNQIVNIENQILD